MGLPKLVRDKIPEIIKSKGQTPKTRTLNEIEYKKYLLDKLQEEAKEVSSAETKEDQLEEIADVLEILKAIAALNNSGLEEIEQIRKKKAESNGGFEKRILLEEIN